MSGLRLYRDTVVELGFKLTPVLLAGRLCQGLGAPGMEAAMTAGTEHQVWGPNWPGRTCQPSPGPFSRCEKTTGPAVSPGVGWAGHLLGINSGER